MHVIPSSFPPVRASFPHLRPQIQGRFPPRQSNFRPPPWCRTHVSQLVTHRARSGSVLQRPRHRLTLPRLHALRGRQRLDFRQACVHATWSAARAVVASGRSHILCEPTDRFARDVLRVCAAAVTGSFVLVGHSFGGAVAAHAAVQSTILSRVLLLPSVTRLQLPSCPTSSVCPL